MSAHEYSEIQFLLANNFWGVDFQFGNNPNGIQIRQGIAHLVDKSSFVKNDPNVAPGGVAVDNPVPPNNGGLLAPNPCLWDTTFGESGVNCVVGAPGGTAYHLATATGVNFVWQPALGSLDFCAAAQHFINAGLATGKDSTTCVLTGISSTVTTHAVNIFVRIDSPPRLDLGRSLAQEICALFGQGFVNGCSPYLTETEAPITVFPAFDICRVTCCTSICLNWWMYTAAFGGVFPFDSSLYFLYNSRFVSGIPSIQPPNGPCSSQSVPTYGPANYMFLCNPAYDSISSQMEFAPCLMAPGDPVSGQTNNGPGGNCPGTSQLSATSAGVQAEDTFGKGAYTIPIYSPTIQFGYLSNWQNVINSDGEGIPNFFTWLNAYSPNPAIPGTIRQGLAQTTHSVNPYIANTAWDLYLTGNIYDSLGTTNPLDHRQLLDWMGVRMQTIQPVVGMVGYTPPPGTAAAIRVTLRQDLFFQNDASSSHPATRVTAWDVAFSYLSMLATGAFQSGGASPTTGITVVNPFTFDLELSSLGAFTPISELSIPILPAQYWTGTGQSAWNSAVGNAISTCTNQQGFASVQCFTAQYTLSPTVTIGTSGIHAVACADSGISSGASGCSKMPANLLNVDPNKVGASYDPIASGIMIGSGPYECLSSTGILGAGCTSTGNQSPPFGGSYTLTRFGKGIAPGSSISQDYFRSIGNLALWVWSGMNGEFTHDFLILLQAMRCYGQPAQPLGSTGFCPHLQQGIGAGGGPTTVGLTQISILVRFVALGWVSPFDWQTNPPTGIVPFPPVLHVETLALNPASLAGCSQPYPAGGYDC
jgi:hypothetical protein